MKIRILNTSIYVLLFSSIFSCKSSPHSDLLISKGDSIIIISSDTLLVSAFNWAKDKSLSFVGSNNDPVGPWYEAALPGREAFCMRDVSHQCVGYEILGKSEQNLNIFRKFVENISEGKDYCSYWELNRYNQPAPVDYSNDKDFWYNLNANFDIIDACYKLYLWTGDPTYISDSMFDNFFRLSLNEYIDRWQLQPDRIMNRPEFMNLSIETQKYRYARGIPSYDEAQENISISGDLLGMIYNGFVVYSNILDSRGDSMQSKYYKRKADQYLNLIDSLWWNEESNSYWGFYKTDGKFYPGGSSQSEFLLWYDVIKDSSRVRKSLLDLQNSQVEVLSYLPYLFYRYGLNSDAYSFLMKIYIDKRRDYPEASSGVIEGVVRGMMGVEPYADKNLLVTCPRLTISTTNISVENIPIYSGLISVRHSSQTKSEFLSKSKYSIIWRAMFQGDYDLIAVNGKMERALHSKDVLGTTQSYFDIEAEPMKQITAEAISN